jgi:hypothetical protein
MQATTLSRAFRLHLVYSFRMHEDRENARLNKYHSGGGEAEESEVG